MKKGALKQNYFLCHLFFKENTKKWKLQPIFAAVSLETWLFSRGKAGIPLFWLKKKLVDFHTEIQTTEE